MNIMPLKYCPKYKEQVIEWLNQEFGCKTSYGFYRELIEHSMKEDKLPITFVAIDNDVLVGTVGLWRGDLLSRQDLFPWLSALVVNQDYRNQKIGQRLQLFIEEYCRNKNYEEIYLYTDLVNYYEKTGWIAFDKGYEYMGGEVTIYKKSLKGLSNS